MPLWHLVEAKSLAVITEPNAKLRPNVVC